jgi:hypothetical protein
VSIRRHLKRLYQKELAYVHVIRKIQKTINRRLIEEEHRFWENSIRKQEQKVSSPDVDIWD